MKKFVPALLLASVVCVGFSLPGFVAPVEAASTVKCRAATPPKGLKRQSRVRVMPDGRQYRFTDRPGWIYARIPQKGWVVMRCFGTWG